MSFAHKLPLALLALGGGAAWAGVVSNAGPPPPATPAPSPASAPARRGCSHLGAYQLCPDRLRAGGAQLSLTSDGLLSTFASPPVRRKLPEAVQQPAQLTT